MKSVRILGKSIPLFVMVLLLAGLASGALLTYYGRITGSATVAQAVVFSDDETEKTYSFDGDVMAGDSYTDLVGIKNRAHVPATAKFETSCTPPENGDCKGITTTYFKPLDYSWSGTTGVQPVAITVEDGGDKVTWTIDFPIEDDTCNGLMAVGLIVALDGEGKGPAFQIHNNDGIDFRYEWGTWLVSPWGPTIDSGWFGWHSSDTNTPVTDLGWVVATGGRYRQDNPDGIFTITIDKSKLGENFHWALYTAIGSGFCNHAYQQATYPSAFSWTEPIVSTTNYKYAKLAEEIEEVTLVPGETMNFAIVNDFDVALVPGTYTITTSVVPVPQ